jgi:hypothetical protein
MVVESIAGVGVPRSQIVFLRGTFQMHMAVACIASQVPQPLPGVSFRTTLQTTMVVE